MHLKLSKPALVLVFLLCGAFLSAQVKLTDFEEKLMDEVWNFRLSVGGYENCMDAIPAIEAFSQKIRTDEIKSNISEEIFLCIDNMLVWERYNVLFENDINNKEIEPLIKAQYEKVKRFQKAHKKDGHTKWFYTSSGDILSCCMQFLPIPTAMSEGLTIKGFYDDAVEADPDFVFGLNNQAQWYFYAPFFAGGSTSKAQKIFTHSFNVAKTVPEKYYTALLLSQSLFDSKRYDDCTKLIDYADKLYPGTRAVKLYRNVNSLGYSMFTYTTDRKKIDKKLREKGLLK